MTISTERGAPRIISDAEWASQWANALETIMAAIVAWLRRMLGGTCGEGP